MVRSYDEQHPPSVFYWLLVCERKTLKRTLIKTSNTEAYLLALSHVLKSIDKVEYYLTGAAANS